MQEAEDLIANDVRFQVRQLRVLAQDFKIQQQAVDLAYRQVENALETFRQPPAPNTEGADPAGLTQQLLNAYGRLPQSQKQLLGDWVNYRTSRQQLYLDMELMWIDDRGVWNDELANDQCSGQCSGQSAERGVPRCLFGAPLGVPAVAPAAVQEKGVAR